jgi:Coenzyme PQQ synthesis protein D (PqqD)
MLTISSSVRLTKSQDGGILLDVEQGEIFRLNPVGTRIIELLKEGHDRRSLTRVLTSEFGVPEQVVREDVCDFLSQLRERRLVAGLDAEAESVGVEQ